MSGNQRKKILIICFKGLKASRRSYRQILALKDDYELHTIGYDDSGVEGVHFYEVQPAFKKMTFFQKVFHAAFFLFGWYGPVYGRLYKIQAAIKQLKGKEFDLVIVHDLKPFPLLDMLQIKAPVICDAHEYYYDRNGGTLMHRLLLDQFDNYLRRRYFEKQKYIITVGEWIAEQYRKKIHGADVQVITSAAEFVNLQPKPVNEKAIRIIHHGMADIHRKTHLMIELADYLDERFTIDLMLVSLTDVYSEYFEKLKAMCATRKNVRIIPPVNPLDIIPFCNDYDIGLYIMPEDSSNMKYCLPNKFFEYLQSRLALAITPNHEMKRITEQYSLGIVSADYSPLSMASALNKLRAEQIDQFKKNAHDVARELTADKQMQQMKAMIASILPPANGQ